jgi:serine/threonine-protein kinase
MGYVFEAEHLGIGRRVALKALHPSLRHRADVLERFEREARLGGLLHHENLVEVLDSGVHEGTPYLVMELLRGESLGTRFERVGPFPVAAAAQILCDVLAGLGAAHQCGIIHRDLKPDNVFLSRGEDGRERAKVLDFGISKSLEPTLLERGLTRFGTVLGTPEYMAPEQALARPDMDHRADLYSAGVVLYQLVTGVLPFQLPDENELLAEVAFQPHGVPSPRRHMPTLPRAFEALIVRALSHNRQQRFADADAFIAALTPWTSTREMTGLGASAPTEPESHSRSLPSLTPLPPEAPSRPPVSPSVFEPRPSAPSLPTSRLRAAAPRFSLQRGLALAALAGLGVLGLLHRMPSAGGQTAPVPASAAASLRTTSPASLEPLVTVDLQNLPGGARVLVDGHPTERFPLTFARGSTHTIRVTAPEMPPYETTLTALRDHSITLARLPEAPVEPPEEDEPPPPPRPTRSVHPAPVRPAPARPGHVRRPAAPAPARPAAPPAAGLSLDTHF